LLINTNKRRWIILISTAFMAFGRFLPPVGGLTASAMQLIGIFIGTLIMWMWLSIDWPSMMCVAALCFVPELSVNGILKSGFGSSTFAFLLFTFMCTYTLSETPFIRRCAIAFVSSKIAGKSPWRFICAYFVGVAFLGLFMSPTVLVVIMIAVTEEIFAVLGLEKGSKTADMMMMGLVFSSGIATGMTPIAHVFPLMAMDYYTAATGKTISYTRYMAAGIPVGILCLLAMIIVFKFILRPDFKDVKQLNVTSLKKELGPMTKKEKYTLTIFALVVVLWILPGVIKPFAPDVSDFINKFGTAMPPLLGAVTMAAVTAEGEPLLNFKKAMSKGVPWASLIMVCATLSLGSALTNKDIALSEWMGEKITPTAQILSAGALLAVFVLWAIIQTNLSSNMVTVTVVSAVALPVALASGKINAGALAVCIGMAASHAFATPPAMATVVFAIGSGWTGTKQVAKYGFILSVISAAVIAAVAYPLRRAVL
jgi:sodium-dependent dicarboxylate transporter 2/3/5